MKLDKLLIILFFSILSLSLITAGTLRHTVYSPFGNIIEQQESSYSSAITEAPNPTTTIIDSRYKDFQEYPDEEGTEPYCKIGGQYMVNVYNNPSPAPVHNHTYKLYYCKTTTDLVKHVMIPRSWQSDNLVVYCNDGQNIYSDSTNFDHIISLLNTYKACVVKNLDLSDNNTIVYGFEVGNRIVDNSPEYFFNHETKVGPVLINLGYENQTASDWRLSKEYGGKVLVPYKKTSWEECNMEENDFGQLEEVCVMQCRYGPRTKSEALNWTITNHDPLASELNTGIDHELTLPVVWAYDNQDDNDLGTRYDSNVNDCGGKVDPDSFVEYLYKIDVYYNSVTENYQVDGENYYFDYDTLKHFYSLTDFYLEDSVSLFTVLPELNSSSLSRVILARKIEPGNKIIYGYENPARLESASIFPNSILPIYKIDFRNYVDYDRNVCELTMGAYTITNGLQANTQVLCKSDEMQIVSDNLNVENKEYMGFNLFKNIVMSMK